MADRAGIIDRTFLPRTWYWAEEHVSYSQPITPRNVTDLGSRSTVPIFAAESTPAPIRGALVMMWYVRSSDAQPPNLTIMRR